MTFRISLEHSLLGLVLGLVAGCSSTPEPKPYMLHSSNATSVGFPGNSIRVLMDARALEGDLAVFELTVPPRTLGAPPHLHHGEDEFFYVLEGKLVFLSQGKEQVCGPGTIVSLPRGHAHGYWNATDTPARALLTITPAGFGEFFDEVVREIRARNINDRAAIGALIAEVAQRYDCEVYGDQAESIVERYGLR